jgi:copper(I)-binding protein
MHLRLTVFVPLVGMVLCAIGGRSVQAAEPVPLGPLRIEHVWSRPTDALAKTGAAYLTITNTGDTPDRLVSVATDAADSAELHRTVNDKGMLRMQPMDALDLPAKSTVTAVPGQVHIMLVNLKAPLELGHAYPMRLTFEKAGSVTVQVSVERQGAPASAPAGMKDRTPPMQHEGMPMGSEHGGMKH